MYLLKLCVPLAAGAAGMTSGLALAQEPVAHTCHHHNTGRQRQGVRSSRSTLAVQLGLYSMFEARPRYTVSLRPIWCELVFYIGKRLIRAALRLWSSWPTSGCLPGKSPQSSVAQSMRLMSLLPLSVRHNPTEVGSDASEGVDLLDRAEQGQAGEASLLSCPLPRLQAEGPH